MFLRFILLKPPEAQLIIFEYEFEERKAGQPVDEGFRVSARMTDVGIIVTPRLFYQDIPDINDLQMRSCG